MDGEMGYTEPGERPVDGEMGYTEPENLLRMVRCVTLNRENLLWMVR